MGFLIFFFNIHIEKKKEVEKLKQKKQQILEYKKKHGNIIY